MAEETSSNLGSVNFYSLKELMGNLTCLIEFSITVVKGAKEMTDTFLVETLETISDHFEKICTEEETLCLEFTSLINGQSFSKVMEKLVRNKKASKLSDKVKKAIDKLLETCFELLAHVLKSPKIVLAENEAFISAMAMYCFDYEN